MARSKKPIDAKLSTDARLLLAIRSLNEVSGLFLGTFFISFIMRSSVAEIASISIYKLVFFIAMMAGFVALARGIKTNSVAVFRLYVIPKIVFVLAIIFFRESIVDFVIPMGVLVGIKAAMYWAPLHLMVREKVSSGALTKFSGYSSLFEGLARIIAPVLLGLFITINSYEEMAWVILAVVIVEFLFTFLLKPARHKSKKKLDFGGFFRCMMKSPVIRKFFSLSILQGATRDGALATVITMYTVYMFKTDFKLGMFTTIFAVCGLITSFMFGRFVKKTMFPRIIVVSTLAALCSLTLFVSHASEITFLIYNFVFATGIALMSKVYSVNLYALSKSSLISKNHSTEYFVFREAAMTIGRVLAYSLLLVVGLWLGYEWLRWYLAVLTFAVALSGYLMIRVDRQIKLNLG
ncbi:MAG: MFS transporter [Alphaproteobacteria bacterium]|nr:MFS transporter [Alphaproteobacteria bacterium]